MAVVADVPRSTRARHVWRSTREFLAHDILASLAALLVLAIIWQLVALVVDAQWLPRPTTVASRLGQLAGDGSFRTAALSSGWTALGGFAVATLLGGACGMAMGLSRIVAAGLKLYLDAVLMIPTVALAPIFVVMLGITSKSVFILTVIYAFGIVTLSTEHAVLGVDRTWMEVGTVFGANRRQLVTRILLPGVGPAFMGGLHLGMARAFKGMIVGQVFLGVLGIGSYEARFEQAFDSVGIWAIAVVLIAMALVLTWLVKLADHIINYWAYTS
jgi:NitT/TauT family transport system permease protein